MDLIPQLIIGVLTVSALLLVILLPTSFSDLDYYEMGFKKNKATGTVETDKVYFGGRYFVGVMNTFKSFRADMHNEQYTHLSISNKEKIVVTLTCAIQYKLRPEDLHLLHDVYDVTYRPIIRATALSAIKSVANQFTIDEFRMDRPKVANGMKAAVAKVLSGTCCRESCNTSFPCAPNCTEYTKCKKEDKGLFATLHHFQLQMVSITKQQEDKFLRTVVLQELKDTNLYLQEETVIRKGIEKRRIQIENKAEEILQNAQANSTLIRAKAEAEAKSIVANARNEGLRLLHTALKMTDEEHKKTLDYVRTLSDTNNAQMYIGFQYMVARP